MKLESIRSLALQLMKKYKINYTLEWFDEPGKFGRTEYDLKRILLNKSLLIHQKDTNVKNTILHEIAHAIDFNNRGVSDNPHDDEWKRIAKKIGCNCNIKSKYDGDLTKIFKWTIICNTCNIKKYKNVSAKGNCNKCNNKLENIWNNTVKKY